MFDKKTIRKEIRNRIAQMTEAQRVSQSLCICEKVEATAEWQSASDVLLYAAMPDEVALTHLFESALSSGKTIWLPVVDGDTLRIRQYIKGKTEISEGFHIEEPASDAPELLPDAFSRIGLAIIPGRAFTLKGERLGRGKGFYDRFLTLYSGTTIGVGFACQIVDEIPVDPWDKQLSSVLSL